MPSLKDLHDQRGRAVEQMRDIDRKATAEKRDMTAEERQQWDRASAEVDRLAEQIKRQKHLDELDNRRGGDPDVGRDDTPRRRKKGDRAAATDEQRSLCFRAWAKGGDSGKIRMTRREREACRQLQFNPNRRILDISLLPTRRVQQAKRKALTVHETRRVSIYESEFRAALSASLNASGAYLISPGTLATAFEMNLLAFGGVRQVAEEITTASGEPYLWPTVDDTGIEGEQLGENTTIGAGVNPAGVGGNPGFTVNRWDAYKFSSKSILIPSEYLDDDEYDLDAQIGEMLGIRLGRRTARAYATGSGSGGPEGIVTGSTLGVTAAAATKFTTDEMRRLQHSIDPAYRGMGCGYLMHDGIIQAVRLLKDGEGRYLWQPGLADGVPDKFDGYPVNTCQEMQSTVATATKVMLFGLLSRYKIRRVKGVRLYRLEERYRDLDQTGFIAFTREDGRLLKTGTGTVKHLLMA